MEEDKKVNYLRIIYLLLIIIPTEYLTLRLFPATEDLYIGIAIFLPMLIGYVLYGIGISKQEKTQKILYLLSLVICLISISSFKNLMSVEGGLDSIGQALALLIVYRFSNIICRVLALLLLIISERKHIFKKKFLIPFFIVAGIIVIIICLIKWIPTLDYREETNMKTLADFKNELDRRNILRYIQQYKVYGINQNGEKELSFDYNSTDQYPEFVFIRCDRADENDWIIYYVNGQITAVYGEFYVSFNGEEKIIWEYPYLVVSENDMIFSYNDEKDVVEKGEAAYHLACKNCNMYIDKPRLCYNSQYCDALAITPKRVEYINKSALMDAANDYLEKNSYKNWSY